MVDFQPGDQRGHHYYAYVAFNKHFRPLDLGKIRYYIHIYIYTETYISDCIKKPIYPVFRFQCRTLKPKK